MMALTEQTIHYTALNPDEIGVIRTRFFLQNDIHNIIFAEIRNCAG